MTDDDDLDDLLDDGHARLEARFRELEREEELRRMRQGGGQPPPSSGPAPDPDDPLADLKARMASDAPVERFLLVRCPHCGATNRMSLQRVRTASPMCGRCKKDLAVER